MDSSPFPSNSDVGNEKVTEPESDAANKRKDVQEDSGATSKPPKTKKPSQRSFVWDHYTRFEDNPKRCKCNYCHRTYGCDSKDGTSNLKNHLRICKHYQAWSQKAKQTVFNNQGHLQSGKVT